MAEIKKIYRQSLPKMKFVGKRYYDEDKKDQTFGEKWNEWFENDYFTPLRLQDDREPFEDANAYIGLCRCKKGEPFEYCIGVFMPPDADVPDGYISIDFDAGEIAVAWIYGKEPDIYSHCCLEALGREKLEWRADSNGVRWCFERYVNPRFTRPDDLGNVILDMCYYI